jgi:serine/threonine-protein kinase
VDGGAATIAIAVNKGKAIAYLCDGNVTEAWLQGTAIDGKLDLSGPDGSLEGTYSNARAAGDVKAGKKSWHFTAGSVKPPSGLYRAAANVRNAKVVGGWIVLSDGTQVGITSVDNEPQSAQPLDTTSLTSSVDGTALTATAVDGDVPLQ